MFGRTRYKGCFPDLEEKYNIRIERHNEFDNEDGDLLIDSFFYRVFNSEDHFMFDVDGSYADIEGQIEKQLKEIFGFQPLCDCLRI